jgi:hypothetical protein
MPGTSPSSRAIRPPRSETGSIIALGLSSFVGGVHRCDHHARSSSKARLDAIDAGARLPRAGSAEWSLLTQVGGYIHARRGPWSRWLASSSCGPRATRPPGREQRGVQRLWLRGASAGAEARKRVATRRSRSEQGPSARCPGTDRPHAQAFCDSLPPLLSGTAPRTWSPQVSGGAW